jgi:hypothetical protein
MKGCEPKCGKDIDLCLLDNLLQHLQGGSGAEQAGGRHSFYSNVGQWLDMLLSALPTYPTATNE